MASTSAFVRRAAFASPAAARTSTTAVSQQRAALARRTFAPRALFNFATKPASADFYNFQVKDIDGRATKLDKFKGKVCLVVNLASQCGFTPQYTELQELNDKYAKQGFAVLGFPCNQFGRQEPGSNSDIKRFAQSNYGVTFPLFAKVDVNGSEADPLFDWLKTQKGGLLGNDIKWNFSKFLVDKEGRVVGRYASTTSPAAIIAEIEKLL